MFNWFASSDVRMHESFGMHVAFKICHTDTLFVPTFFADLQAVPGSRGVARTSKQRIRSLLVTLQSEDFRDDTSSFHAKFRAGKVKQMTTSKAS